MPLRAGEGKVVVVMVPSERARESGLIIPDEVASKYQPDYGVVSSAWACDDNKRYGGRLKGCRCPSCQNLKVGDLVAVKPYTGVWYTHADFDWIPEGRMVKIVGNVDPWDENILAWVRP